MYRIFFKIASLFWVCNLQAQIIFHTVDSLYIAPDTELYIHGDLSNEGEEFENQGEIELTGNLTNETEVNFPFSGTLILAGNQEQLIELSAPFTTDRLIFNNSSGFSFVGDQHLKIDGYTTFNQGMVFTQNESSLYFNDASFAIGASNKSFVHGPCYKFGLDQFVFPIGKNNRYRPLIIDQIDSPTTFRAHYFDEGYNSIESDQTLAEVSDWEYWEFERILGESGAQLTLTTDATSFGNSDIEHVQIAYLNDEEWTKVDATDTIPEQFESSFSSVEQINNFGYFTFGATDRSALLRDDIMDFSLRKQACDIVLNWTSFERKGSIQVYEIYRSSEGGLFEFLGNLNAQNTTLFNTYNFVDSEPEEFIFYTYKIVAILDDGSTLESEIRQVKSSCAPISATLFPNPARSGEPLTLQLDSDVNKNFTVQIVDYIGRLMYEQRVYIKKGTNTIIFDTRNFSAEQYYIWSPEPDILPTLPFQIHH